VAGLLRRIFLKRIDIYAPFGVVVALWMWPCEGALGWALYGAGAGLILLGGLFRFWAARYCGKRRPETPERRLATTGPYALLRNPLYAANMLIAAGFMLLAHTWWLVPLFLLYAVIRHNQVVKREERSLERRFGEEYLLYKKAVPRWLPNPLRLFRTRGEPLHSWGKALRREAGGTVMVVVSAGLMTLKSLYLAPMVTGGST